MQAPFADQSAPFADQSGEALIRDQLPPSVRELLQKYGSYRIIDVLVGRHPIAAAIKSILNITQAGQLNDKLKKMQYDDIYHLFMLVKIANPNNMNERLILKSHKEEVIRLERLPSNDFESLKKQPEIQTANVPTFEPITLQQWFERTKQSMGPGYFYYDSIKNNCQHYVLHSIHTLGVKISPQLHRFIVQNASQLINNSKLLSGVMRVATDLGAIWDRIRFGRGIE
jgi:hypothetical protein